MKYCIQPGAASGALNIPPSKSHTLRAILFGLMAKGTSIVRNYLHSPDTIAMIKAVQNFGAKVQVKEDRLEIEGVGGQLKPAENVIDSGNSGQVLRFIGALAGLLPSYTVLTGDHSIRNNRPVLPLLEGLRSLGVFAESACLDGKAPIIIKGPIQGGKIAIDGADSQPVSGLLIASSFADGKTQIHVNNPGEKPWIDLTLHWLDFLNVPYENNHYTDYTLFGNASYEGFDFTIPGDFSSLAYPLIAALITDSELQLGNVDMEDSQGDKKLIDILIRMGARIKIDHDKRELSLEKGCRLVGQTLDINDTIDAISILAVLGCYIEGRTEISNAAIARHKESDRIQAIVTELKKMGADIEEKEDGLVVRRCQLSGGHLRSYQDHRIAMSLSVAALGAIGESQIEDIECVSKTYPTFAEHFQMLGVNIKEKQ